MNQIVLEHLDPAAWRAQLPGSKGRTIAAIVVHVHNMRRKWLRLSAPHLKLPAPLDRARCTQKQARAALVESAARCSEMLADALSRPQEPGRNFSPRRLGEAVARRPNHAGLHDFARRASSRPGVYAGPSARIPTADEGRRWDLGLGKTMEGMRIHASAIRISFRMSGVLQTKLALFLLRFPGHDDVSCAGLVSSEEWNVRPNNSSRPGGPSAKREPSPEGLGHRRMMIPPAPACRGSAVGAAPSRSASQPGTQRWVGPTTAGCFSPCAVSGIP